MILIHPFYTSKDGKRWQYFHYFRTVWLIFIGSTLLEANRPGVPGQPKHVTFLTIQALTIIISNPFQCLIEWKGNVYLYLQIMYSCTIQVIIQVNEDIPLCPCAHNTFKCKHLGLLQCSYIFSVHRFKTFQIQTKTFQWKLTHLVSACILIMHMWFRVTYLIMWKINQN